MDCPFELVFASATCKTAHCRGGLGEAHVNLLGKPRKVDSPKKKKRDIPGDADQTAADEAFPISENFKADKDSVQETSLYGEPPWKIHVGFAQTAAAMGGFASS